MHDNGLKLVWTYSTGVLFISFPHNIILYHYYIGTHHTSPKLKWCEHFNNFTKKKKCLFPSYSNGFVGKYNAYTTYSSIIRYL